MMCQVLFHLVFLSRHHCPLFAVRSPDPDVSESATWRRRVGFSDLISSLSFLPTHSQIFFFPLFGQLPRPRQAHDRACPSALQRLQRAYGADTFVEGRDIRRMCRAISSAHKKSEKGAPTPAMMRLSQVGEGSRALHVPSLCLSRARVRAVSLRWRWRFSTRRARVATSSSACTAMTSSGVNPAAAEGGWEEPSAGADEKGS